MDEAVRTLDAQTRLQMQKSAGAMAKFGRPLGLWHPDRERRAGGAIACDHSRGPAE